MIADSEEQLNLEPHIWPSDKSKVSVHWPTSLIEETQMLVFKGHSSIGKLTSYYIKPGNLLTVTSSIQHADEKTYSRWTLLHWLWHINCYCYIDHQRIYVAVCVKPQEISVPFMKRLPGRPTVPTGPINDTAVVDSGWSPHVAVYPVPINSTILYKLFL